MRYLPSKMVSEPFWAQLLPKIARLLEETRVLRPWSGGPLNPLSQLKRVPAYFLDEAGVPMFEDMIDETYLSAGYEDIDFQLLEGLAVGELSFEILLTRIRADLKDPFSRWKSSGTSDLWITRSSSMFKELGLRYCYPKKVIALILEKYNTWNDVPLHCSVSHIRYLYRHLPENEPNLPRTVYLRDQESRPIYRRFVTPWARTAIKDDLYFKTDDEYGPGELLKALP